MPESVSNQSAGGPVAVIEPPVNGTPAPVAPVAAVADGTVLGAKAESVASVVPEKYTYEPPKGVELDTEAVTSFQEVAKAAGLSNEQFGKVIEFGLKRQQSLSEAKAKSDAETLAKDEADALATLQKDPELGGANYEETKRLAAEGFQKFATPEDMEFINATRLGNRVPMIRLFRKIALAFKEDSVSGKGTNAGAGPLSDQEIAREMYPTMFTGKE